MMAATRSQLSVTCPLDRCRQNPRKNSLPPQKGPDGFGQGYAMNYRSDFYSNFRLIIYLLYVCLDVPVIHTQIYMIHSSSSSNKVSVDYFGLTVVFRKEVKTALKPGKVVWQWWPLFGRQQQQGGNMRQYGNNQGFGRGCYGSVCPMVTHKKLSKPIRLKIEQRSQATASVFQVMFKILLQ
jgi:hypothetical protein